MGKYDYMVGNLLYNKEGFGIVLKVMFCTYSLSGLGPKLWYAEVYWIKPIWPHGPKISPRVNLQSYEDCHPGLAGFLTEIGKDSKPPDH